MDNKIVMTITRTIHGINDEEERLTVRNDETGWVRIISTTDYFGKLDLVLEPRFAKKFAEAILETVKEGNTNER